MIVFGIVENIKGVSFPLIKESFGASYNEQGSLVSFSWYGYVLFCILAAVFVSKIGGRRTLLFGYAFLCAGCLAVALAPSFLLTILSLMIVWMGFGFFEVGVNAVAVDAFSKNSAVYMNLLHFFYGVGAIISPILSGAAVRSFSFGYRGLYLAALAAALLVFFAFLPGHKKEDKHSASSSGGASILKALKTPSVWLLAVALGFMEVIEFGAANWGGLYYMDTYGLDPATAGAAFVSGFYLLFTLSRLLSGFLIEKAGYYRSLLFSLGATAILYCIGFLSGPDGRWVLIFTGATIGVLWPTVMCYAMELFRENTPLFSSVIIVISGALNGVFQLIIGFTNEYAGPSWGYPSCIVYTLLAFAMIVITSRNAARRVRAS